MKKILENLSIVTAIMLITVITVISQSKSVLSNVETDANDLQINSNIRSVFQDAKGNMWVGTEGNGVYKLTGDNYEHYTKKDGLPGNFVWTINQDKKGNMWFGTNEGIASFNGMFFIDHTKDKDFSYRTCSGSLLDSKGNLWFGTKGGYYTFDGYKLNYTALPITEENKKIYKQEYSAYSIFEDVDGSFYFGTEFRGVCKFNGKEYQYINENGLDKGAIRSIHKDKNGILWFGNNGLGIFRYDGKTLRNISEEKGLLNLPNKSNNASNYNLSRVWTITSDIAGNVWIGTIDGGAWRFDGTKLSNYKIIDGLQSNGVQHIFRDNTGKLWFGMIGGGLSTFDGSNFKVVLKGNPNGC